ncbi:MAG: hypothetical protein ACREHC_00805 [Candidatus Levyibacteriota bacterium]
MRTVRVYKDNVREHIFRSLFFTDTVIFLGIGLFLAVIIFVLYKFVFHFFQYGVYVSTIFIVELLYALVATLRIDNQPIYKIIPRAIIHSFTKKHFAMKELDSTISDFKIIDNYILRKKRLITVYEIRPYDIALLNEEDREQFYLKIKTTLHTLPGKVQLIVRKEVAKTSDYQDHFFSLYKDAQPKREQLIENYINDITKLLDLEKFQMVKYYAVFSTPLSSIKETDFVAACERLYDMGIRFSSGLEIAQITIRQLKKESLVTYFQSQFRNL